LEKDFEKVDEEPKEKEELKVEDLKKYAGFDKNLMDCYKFVIEGRFKSMHDFYEKHIAEEKKKDESTSKVTKLGRGIRTVFIYGSVASLMGIVLYG
jgi:hypothetical protein